MPRGVTTTRPASTIDLGALADDVQAFLDGEPVSLLMKAAEDGTAVLDVLSPNLDDDPKITPAELRALVDAHVKPAPPVDPLDALIDTLTAANTVPQLKTALVDWARATKARERPIRPTGPPTERGGA